MSEVQPLENGGYLGTTEKWTCEDRNGVVRKYWCYPFKAAEGEAILAELLALLGPTMGSIAVSMAMGDGEGLDRTVDIDASAIGGELRQAIRSGNLPGLRERLLAKTFRDGAALKLPGNFDAAYAGNYQEMYAAQWEVLRVNGLFMGFDTFLSKGLAAVKKLAEPAEVSETQSDSSPSTPPAEA